MFCRVFLRAAPAEFAYSLPRLRRRRRTARVDLQNASRRSRIIRCLGRRGVPYLAVPLCSQIPGIHDSGGYIFGYANFFVLLEFPKKSRR